MRYFVTLFYIQGRRDIFWYIFTLVLNGVVCIWRKTQEFTPQAKSWKMWNRTLFRRSRIFSHLSIHPSIQLTRIQLSVKTIITHFRSIRFCERRYGVTWSHTWTNESMLRCSLGLQEYERCLECRDAICAFDLTVWNEITSWHDSTQSYRCSVWCWQREPCARHYKYTFSLLQNTIRCVLKTIWWIFSSGEMIAVFW